MDVFAHEIDSDSQLDKYLPYTLFGLVAIMNEPFDQGSLANSRIS